VTALSEKAFEYATQRVEDFAVVQLDSQNKLEAVELMLESVGLDDDRKSQFCQWLQRFNPSTNEGDVLLGLLVGLFLHQYFEDEIIAYP
jgi:hypothetical protein